MSPSYVKPFKASPFLLGQILTLLHGLKYPECFRLSLPCQPHVFPFHSVLVQCASSQVLEQVILSLSGLSYMLLLLLSTLPLPTFLIWLILTHHADLKLNVIFLQEV